MKTIRHILLFLQTVLLLGLISCRDDFSNNNADEHQPMFSTGIRLRIPNFANAARFADTRAGSSAGLMDNEGVIAGEDGNHDIWLFIYPSETDRADNEDYIFRIPLSHVASLTTDTYTKGEPYKINGATEDSYYIPMPAGLYRAYVVANLSEYLDSPGFSSISETNLKKLTLNFADVYDGTTDKTKTLRPGHLPMVCMPVNVEGANANGVFDVMAEDLTSLKCTLSFLCAKVRYTVLFDNSEDGFSNDKYGSNKFLDYNGENDGAFITYVRKETPFNAPSSYEPADDDFLSNSVDRKITLDPKVYPDATDDTEKHYFCGTDCNLSNDAGYNAYKNTLLNDKTGAFTNSDAKRAWQGVAYLPENLSTDSDYLSTVELRGTVNGESAQTYKFKLIEDNSGNIAEIKRGKFYDLTLLAKGLTTYEINFEVSEWSVENLVYDLHGPYYLIVDKTKVTLTTGEETEITYTTNAEQIEWSSPKYTTSAGVVVDVFDISVRDGKIVASVGTGIPASELSNIKDNINYSYFHIKAGNINKRIDVKLEDLVPTLTVSPDGITIDVGAEIASGNYNDYFEITVKTNCKQYMISSSDLSTAGGLIYLTDENDNPVTLDTPRTPTKGVEKLRLHYTGLNDGKLFWTGGTNDLNLTFSAVDASISNLPDPVDLPVDTRPGSSNYTIYMKSDYGLPHIYVYQCLEFPGWYQKDNYKYANKAIGYKKDGIYFAALEYSFTGKIAFKGWEQQDNKDFLATFSGDWEEGFYMTDYGTDNTWHAPNDTKGKRYDIYYDFVGKYRQDQTACPSCKNDKPHDWTTNYWGYHQLWPGIVMERVKDDKGNDTKWCKFELTGTATPGKALIMFNDGHTDGSRYPDKGMVGIPLFNYESKVGYIDLTSSNKQFFSETPKELLPPDIRNFRIIWNSATHGQKAIHVWDKNEGNTLLDKLGTQLESGSDYYYVDFTSDVNWLQFNILFLESVNSWGSKESKNNEGITFESVEWKKSGSRYEWTVPDSYLTLKQ